MSSPVNELLLVTLIAWVSEGCLERTGLDSYVVIVKLFRVELLLRSSCRGVSVCS